MFKSIGGVTGTRTQKPDYAGRQISNLLQYHYGTTPKIAWGHGLVLLFKSERSEA